MRKATWNDLVCRLVPGVSEKEVRDILWGHTCFPFGTVLQVARQLRAYAQSVKEREDEF